MRFISGGVGGAQSPLRTAPKGHHFATGPSPTLFHNQQETLYVLDQLGLTD